MSWPEFSGEKIGLRAIMKKAILPRQWCASCGPLLFPDLPVEPLLTNNINSRNILVLCFIKSLCDTSSYRSCLRVPRFKNFAHHCSNLFNIRRNLAVQY